MRHESYLEISAESNHQMGHKLGSLFAKSTQRAVRRFYREHDVSDEHSQQLFALCLESAEEAIPDVIDELKGYAEGAKVTFQDMMWVVIGDELDNLKSDRCTTAVTSNGLLIGHNEDWPNEAQNELYVLKKIVVGVTSLELYYADTLGGIAISINSKGYVQAINTLTHTDCQEGIPRNLVARWLSATKDPESDYAEFQSMRRCSGYNHNLVSSHGAIFNIESTALRSILSGPKSPFCHTNHYLKEELIEFEGDFSAHSRERYKRTGELLREHMSVTEMQTLLSDGGGADPSGIFNKDTIGRVVVDLENLKAYIWLRREESLGWVPYDVSFLR